MMLVNGEVRDHIPVTDRGLQYGDGLFETIEVQAGRAIFFGLHLNRLLNGCIRLQIPAPSIDLIRHEALSLLASDNTLSNPPGDCVLKIIVTRGSGGRGYRQPACIEPTRIMSLHAAPDYPPAYQTQGINARFCQTRLALNPLLAGIKHLNRLEQVMARAEWCDPDIQEGIMRDIDGHIIEGTMSNVFLVKDGILHTPILSHSGIAGIIRSAIIKLAHQHHISIFEHLFDSELLLSADEVFVSNSVIGIWPVKQLETTTFRIGSVTLQLQQWLDQLKRE
jgi:4-amino-4-deoxychorismate lyase